MAGCGCQDWFHQNLSVSVDGLQDHVWFLLLVSDGPKQNLCVLQVQQQFFTMSSSNISSRAVEEKHCIVNNQMGPFIVLYILILMVGLPGNLLSLWAFIQTRRTQVGRLRT